MEDYKEDINQHEEFWRHLRINEEGFLNQAESGDLIFCEDKKKVKKVYLLMKMQIDNEGQNELHVVSTGRDQGVIIGTWEQFKEYKQGRFRNVIFRHLFCDRD